MFRRRGMKDSRSRTSPRSRSSASRATHWVYCSQRSLNLRAFFGPASREKRILNLPKKISLIDCRWKESANLTYSFVIFARTEPSSQAGSCMACTKIRPVARASLPFWSSLTSSRTKRRLTLLFELDSYGVCIEATYKIACCTELLIASVGIHVRTKKFVRPLHEKCPLSIGEDVITVNPSPGFCCCFQVERIRRVLQGTTCKQVGNNKLACR